MRFVFVLFLGMSSLISAQAREVDIALEPANESENLLHTAGQPEHNLVEFFTADTLRQGEWMLGTIANYGLTARHMIGFDIVSMMIGAPNFYVKSFLWSSERHSLALGIQGSYLDRDTVLWGSMHEHFDQLSVSAIKATLNYTRRVSSRLRIHSSFSLPHAKIEARLSEKGRRKLFESKYPNGDFSTGEKNTNGGAGNSSGNQAIARNESGTYAQRTQQVSSITGMASETFQITGDILRENGNRVLVSSRIEQTRILNLRANNFRITVAQQWIWDHFRFRLGLGLQYLVLSGQDLDDEKLDEAGVLPASDINFYWRF